MGLLDRGRQPLHPRPRGVPLGLRGRRKARNDLRPGHRLSFEGHLVHAAVLQLHRRDQVGEARSGSPRCSVMYRYEDIRHVHFEPTTRCNAQCPMCARNARGLTAPGLDLVEQSIEDVHRIFPHNEQQIAEARRLSQQLGFRQFAIKKTARFLKPVYDYVPEVDSTASLAAFPIYSPAGERIGSLEPPMDTSLVNETARRYGERIDGRGSLDAGLSSTPIHCQVMDTRSVFVRAEGSVFPR